MHILIKFCSFLDQFSFLSTSSPWDQNLIVMQHQIVQLETISLLLMMPYTRYIHFQQNISCMLKYR